MVKVAKRGDPLVVLVPLSSLFVVAPTGIKVMLSFEPRTFMNPALQRCCREYRCLDSRKRYDRQSSRKCDVEGVHQLVGTGVR